jgi:hypothetical protein
VVVLTHRLAPKTVAADGELEDEEEDVAAGAEAEAEAEAVPDCETTVESSQSNAADDRRPAMYGGAAASDGKQPPEDDADKGVEAAPASDDSKVTATRTGSDSDQVTDAPTEAVAKPTDSMDTT